jgi:hypothetical protein
MKLRARGLRVLLVVGLVAALGACGDDDDSDAGETPTTEAEAASGNVLTISEREYAFTVSGSPKAGTLTIGVSNEGEQLHEIAIAKLKAGKTLDDAKAALAQERSDDENPLVGITEEDAAIDDLGGIQFPGSSLAATGGGVDAGEYVLMCFIPNAEGKPHFSLGMLTSFTVAEGDDDSGAAALPDEDATYTVTDAGLDGPKELAAGETTFLVKNDSSTSREINLVKVKAGKTVTDVETFFKETGDDLPDVAKAPTEFFAFVFDAEQDRTITLELTPGQWAIQTPDPEKPFEGPIAENKHAVLLTVT